MSWRFHELEVHLNLASRMTLTGINQLWVADIAYIRLHREFVYLAVILDKFSRKVVGWELDRTLADCRSGEGDRGSATAARCSASFRSRHSVRVWRLRGHFTEARHDSGMSRPANPYDNAGCESFMKTLRREEINAGEYRDLDHLRENIAEFIDNYYNGVRLHSALGYKPPEEFEQAAGSAENSQGATMSFFRHEEICRSDVTSNAKGEPAETGSPDHRLDESPSGYSPGGLPRIPFTR